MKILIIGSGGREHALAKKISESPEVSRIVVAPGNAGMKKSLPGLETFDFGASDCKKLLKFALAEKFDLTVVGPESTLSLGIVDLFQKKQSANCRSKL